ncbi:MerR family transcriptional regulator, partial [Gordonibacter sp.]|uniref:MerR family transcriptional regulator n=1 Tax=Gordonibacter sp. TaxID=1968902 RepID=UPI002FC9FCAF
SKHRLVVLSEIERCFDCLDDDVTKGEKGWGVMSEDNLANFSSGELSKHLGMSSQGLFWYEKERLIRPSKENGRRVYSTDDLYLLSRIRFYRQAGFSLEQADEMLNLDIDDVAARLYNQVKTMRETLRKEEARVAIVEQRANLIQSFKQQEGVFASVGVEPFYFKESFVRYGESETIEKFPMRKHWVQDIPFTQYVSILEDSLHSPNVAGIVGLALPECYLDFASAETREEIESGVVRRYAPESALYGLVASEAASDQALALKVAQCISEPLEGKTIMKRPILSRRQKDGALAYWEVWFF